jgi:hypothetical protein
VTGLRRQSSVELEGSRLQLRLPGGEYDEGMMSGREPLDHREAVELARVGIHEHQVGTECGDHGAGARSVRCFSHQRDVRERGERVAQRGAAALIAIHDQRTDGRLQVACG